MARSVRQSVCRYQVALSTIRHRHIQRKLGLLPIPLHRSVRGSSRRADVFSSIIAGFDEALEFLSISDAVKQKKRRYHRHLKSVCTSVRSFVVTNCQDRITITMPQIIIEHSKGLDEEHCSQGGQPSTLQHLCDELWQSFASHPSVTSPDTVRVRCICSTASRIYGGSGPTDNQSFAHATLLLLPGRSDEMRQELAQLIMDTLQKHLPNVQSLSVRLDDINQPYLKVMKDK